MFLIKTGQNSKNTKTRAFTLIELLIVISITVVLSVVGVINISSQAKKRLLESTTQEIVSYLRYAQQKSIAEEAGLIWGVHFENATSSPDFYALFSGEIYNEPIETKFLPQGIEFSDPVSGQSRDVIFNKFTGTNYSESEQAITLIINTGATSTITISAGGVVSY